MSKEEYDLTWKFWRSASREQGIDRILKDYDCDVIIGPADSGLPTYASASGKSSTSPFSSSFVSHAVQFGEWEC